MGLSRRARSGNVFGGSRLNVPGQGIYNVKVLEADKIPIKQNKSEKPSPTPKPKVIIPPCDILIEVFPIPDFCYLSEDGIDNLLTEDNQNLILNCEDVP